MKVTLRREDYNIIISHAVSELPNEACGLLAGYDENDNPTTSLLTERPDKAGHNEHNTRTILKVYLLTNTDSSPEHFSLDPKEQLQAVKDMRAKGLKLLGNWHSHPKSPARPSQEDIRLAFDSRLSYFILSLMNSEAPELKSFHIENGTSTQEELIII